MKYNPDLSPRKEEPEPGPDSGPDPGSNSHETSLGTTENVAGLLTYVLGWVTGVVFLFIEKENRFVRFHAMQSVVVFVPLTVLSWVIGILPFFGFFAFIGDLLWVLTLFLWLFLMFQAFQGKRYKLPFAGDYAESQLINMGSR